MMRRSRVVIAALVGLLATSTSVASAQRTSPTPNDLEFGIDAGATFGFGDINSVQLTLPASRFRVGFFLPNSRRKPNLAWRLEANTGYGFDNKAFRLGLLAGLSFFTK